MNKKYIAIALVVVLAILCLLLGGRGADKTAEQAIKAIYENDASSFVSLMHKDVIESQMDTMGLATKKLLVKRYEEAFDSMQKTIVDKYGKKYKYDIKIIDSYECESIPLFSDKKMKEVAFEVVYEGKGLLKKKEDSERVTIQLVKSGSKWYVADFN